MSDKNIDKDIEIVKSIINKMKKNKFIIQYKDLYINEEDIQVIENALLELEKYKRIANMNLKDSEEFNKNMCEHRCPIKSDYEEVKQELETYKKIAEKLADEMDKITEEVAREKGIDDFDFCNSKCHNEDNYIECKQCIIDWARKEVEK